LGGRNIACRRGLRDAAGAILTANFSCGDSPLTLPASNLITPPIVPVILIGFFRHGAHVISRRVFVVLVAAALALPIANLILMAAGQLLAAMQDTLGAAVLGRLSLAVGLVWVVDLVALLIIQALDRLGPPPGSPGDVSQGPPDGPIE